jgi:hypothetical protein
MILWFIKISIVSILLIIIVHHLFLFLQNNFSVPIIKDFVDINDKYEDMMNTITEKDISIITEKDIPITDFSIIKEKDVSLINDLPIANEEENINMKIELKNFLKFEL